MIQLTDEAIGLIKSDKPLFNKIFVAMGITERTMYNYVNSNSDELIKISCLNELVTHTGRPLSDLITGPKLSKLMSK